MPELPEVETVVRSIAPHIAGRTIEQVELYSRFVTRGGLKKTARQLAGRAIQKVWRRGKNIFIDLDHGVLYVHLGMTGKLLWDSHPGKYTRAIFSLENGSLLYDDIRQFGRVEYFKSLPKFLQRTGPDALSLVFDEFHTRLLKRTGQIKALLLNQSFIAGVGNIYADETLFAASIHPKTQVARISKMRAEKLHKSLLEVLHQAIHHRGSSVSDYVDGDGEKGAFQTLHAVYGRAGQPCPRCGAPIRRIVVAQRGTHYCARCQRA
ncbi:MAG: bifunctional DNA-formamidopyrimidine glycosylase/DNA-(apurinic or apyrimidinic site) lyase [Acidobacteriaceae bacterium]|nr:bifunctional DNA-formamidopyrimidine glycosylase/DNA-(apurinic or apyrimidinic site) lyase [Acidobacteriaceae bacterium]